MQRSIEQNGIEQKEISLLSTECNYLFRWWNFDARGSSINLRSHRTCRITLHSNGRRGTRMFLLMVMAVMVVVVRGRMIRFVGLACRLFAVLSAENWRTALRLEATGGCSHQCCSSSTCVFGCDEFHFSCWRQNTQVLLKAAQNVNKK